MNVYVVVIRADREDPSGAVATFVDDRLASFQPCVYEFVPNAVWVVGTKLRTCHDVVEKIGFLNPEDQTARILSSIVVKCDDYNGFAESSLWEKIEEWERTDGSAAQYG